MTADDPIAALADMIASIEQHLDEQGGRARRSEANRLALLGVHGIAAAIIGPLFCLSSLDGPAWVMTRRIPGAPWSMGLFFAIGGVVLLSAVARRAKRWEIVGLGMLATWYLVMALGFAAAIGIWVVTRPPGPPPNLYAPAVYLHLSTIMTVHIATLWQSLRRSPP